MQHQVLHKYIYCTLICTAFKLLAQAKGVEATNFEGRTQAFVGFHNTPRNHS